MLTRIIMTSSPAWLDHSRVQTRLPASFFLVGVGVKVDQKNVSSLCFCVVYLESAQILVFPVDAFVFVVAVIDVFVLSR